jgi:thiol-disulfide isomerase/thioredoxin
MTGLIKGIACMGIAISVYALFVPSVKIDSPNQRLANGNDTIYVVNFWATWCAPCVAELPYFEQIDSAFAEKKVKVILVSTDFKKDINTRLIPFIEKKKLHSEVNFLDELYDNEWIPKMDSSWQGNIPATKIYNAKTKKSVFLPRETSYAELDSLIISLSK